MLRGVEVVLTSRDEGDHPPSLIRFRVYTVSLTVARSWPFLGRVVMFHYVMPRFGGTNVHAYCMSDSTLTGGV